MSIITIRSLKFSGLSVKLPARQGQAPAQALALAGPGPRNDVQARPHTQQRNPTLQYLRQSTSPKVMPTLLAASLNHALFCRRPSSRRGTPPSMQMPFDTLSSMLLSLCLLFSPQLCKLLISYYCRHAGQVHATRSPGILNSAVIPSHPTCHVAPLAHRSTRMPRLRLPRGTPKLRCFSGET